MKQNTSWEARSISSGQEMLCFTEPERSLPCSQESAIGPQKTN
jgi:hypothetical protein